MTLSTMLPILELKDELLISDLLDGLNDDALDAVVGIINKTFKSLDRQKKIKLIIKSLQLQFSTGNTYDIIQFIRTISTEADYVENIHQSYFDYLPTESIFNICEFLDKQDIGNFKIASRKLAIIALNIMKGHKIKVFNMNELIEQNDYKYPLRVRLTDKWKMIFRPHLFTSKATLFNFCKSRYNIQNILPIQDENSNVLVFDKNKIHQLSDQQIISNKIILLQYFDVYSQRIQNIQFLSLIPTTSYLDILNYIKNDLYTTYKTMYKNLSCSWCESLMSTVQKMEHFGSTPDCKLINIYTFDHKSKEGYQPIDLDQAIKHNANNIKDTNITLIAFELNSNHPYFKNRPAIIADAPLKPIYQTIYTYFSSETQKTIFPIKHCSSINVCLDQIEYFKSKSDGPDVNVPLISDITIIHFGATNINMIKRQISAKLNHLISPYQIQLYPIEKWKHFEEWDIVPYNTMKEFNYGIIYKVSFYNVNTSRKHGPNILTPKNDIPSIVEIISHPMYRDIYKPIIDQYQRHGKYSLMTDKCGDKYIRIFFSITEKRDSSITLFKGLSMKLIQSSDIFAKDNEFMLFLKRYMKMELDFSEQAQQAVILYIGQKLVNKFKTENKSCCLCRAVNIESFKYFTHAMTLLLRSDEHVCVMAGWQLLNKEVNKMIECGETYEYYANWLSYIDSIPGLIKWNIIDILSRSNFEELKIAVTTCYQINESLSNKLRYFSSLYIRIAKTKQIKPILREIQMNTC